MFSIKHPLSYITLYLNFSLLRLFFVLDDIIDLETWRRKITARHHTFKKIIAKMEILNKGSCLKEDISLKKLFT